MSLKQSKNHMTKNTIARLCQQVENKAASAMVRLQTAAIFFYSFTLVFSEIFLAQYTNGVSSKLVTT